MYIFFAIILWFDFFKTTFGGFVEMPVSRAAGNQRSIPL